MAFEHRPGTGSLFANKNKRPDKQDADFDAHEKKFNKYVNIICDLYKFNREEF